MCRRNQLVALDLIVTVFAAGFGLIAAIAGICGMNLSPLPIQNTEARVPRKICLMTFCPALDSLG